MAEAGKALSIEDVEEILEAMEARHQNFPKEPFDMTLMLVLLNIGDRYSKVSCVDGEWSGQKKDVNRSSGEGIPQCPNGHSLVQDSGLKLGWLDGS